MQTARFEMSSSIWKWDKKKQELGGHLRDKAPLNLTEAVQSRSRVAVTDPYLLSTLLQMLGGNTFKTRQALLGWTILGQMGTLFLGGTNPNAFEGHRGALVGKGVKYMFENKIRGLTFQSKATSRGFIAAANGYLSEVPGRR
ncbi:hypothetical protein B0H14DRAFT_2592702 [Mycena olivaceomarginata]|nr:hypothetical protein B0H14DRAFT_2592702 [Mycena olivaceomarginata]